MPTIRILTQAITAQHGTLNPGDELTCTEEEAQHLVEQAGCAQYVTQQPEPVSEPAQAQAPATETGAEQ